MQMIGTNLIEKLFDAEVLDSDDDKIGTVSQVLVDEGDGHPTWAAVRTGLFGTKETFVPLDSATYSDEVLHVAFPKDVVRGAPRVDSDGGLSPQEEDVLYDYYETTDPHVDEPEPPPATLVMVGGEPAIETGGFVTGIRVTSTDTSDFGVTQIPDVAELPPLDDSAPPSGTIDPAPLSGDLPTEPEPRRRGRRRREL
jgi:hypothetical protein